MKLKLLSAIWITCNIFMTVLAQDDRTFSFESSLGLNASQISGDGTHGFAQFGVQFGGYIYYQKNDNFQYSAGLLLSQKGARKYQTADNISTYRLRTNYIDLPLEIQYSFKDFYFTLGPSFNVLVNYSEGTEFGPTETERSFSLFEFSGVGSVGYQIKDKLGVRLYYQNSLLPVREHDDTFYFPPTNSVLVETYHKLYNLGQYHSLFTLQVRYKISNL